MPVIVKKKWKWAGHIRRRTDGRWGRKEVGVEAQNSIVGTYLRLGRSRARWTNDLVKVRTEWSGMHWRLTILKER